MIRVLRLGWLIPRLLGAVFALDVAARFLPADAVAFRGWEAMGRYPVAEGPLEPGKQYHNPRTYGDLANMANRPDLREYRPETFTTDAAGFRNPPGSGPRETPAAVLLGSSFSIGVGSSDDDILSAKLAAAAGRPVYNAAGIDADPDLIRPITRRLGMTRGLVICEHLERYDLPLVPPPGVPGAPAPGADAGGRVQGQVAFKQRLKESGLFYVLRRAKWWLDLSPVKIFAGRVVREVQDGRILPNPLGDTVETYPISGGGEMVLPRHGDGPPAARGITRAADYWSWLSAEMAREGLTLVILLVPEKDTVYRPLLTGGPPAPDFCGELGAELGRRGVRAVNVAPALVRAAAAGLPNGETVYWRDDTHWNPRGVAVAAAEFCRVCPPATWTDAPGVTRP